jgi:hypothetical protein
VLLGIGAFALAFALLPALPPSLNPSHTSAIGGVSVGTAHAAAASATWNGRYIYTGGSLEWERVQAAIDRVVASLHLVSRAIARARLVEVSEPYDALRLEITSGEIRVALGGHPVVSPRDGSAVRTRTPNGTRASVRQEIHGRELVQVLHTRSGTRHNLFRLSADGERLEARVRIAADRLPEELHYVLTYRRVR